MGTPPLNGVRAMTRDERNARRRELDKNPFHHALSRKTANAYRAKNKERINARRREKYEANKEAIRERAKEYRAEHKDVIKKYWKRWAAKPENKARLKRKYRERYAKAEYREKQKEQRRERMKNPAYRARINAKRRLQYRLNKDREIGFRWRMTYLWLPRWRKIAAEGMERIEKFRKRCHTVTWSWFVKWYRMEYGIQLDPQKNVDEKRRWR